MKILLNFDNDKFITNMRHIILIFSLLLFAATAIQAQTTWQIGFPNSADVTATLNDDGRFIISGTGAMQDFPDPFDVPWFDIRYKIIRVEIQNGITTIGESLVAFSKKLTTVKIPSSVTSIPNNAFFGCTKLTAINVDVNNANYSSNNGVLYNKTKTTLVCCAAGKTGAYTIPNTVTSIYEFAFAYCENLTSVTIPSSVTVIPKHAFFGCRGLKSISIPNSVTSIDEWAFSFCGFTSVSIPNSITTISASTFQGCSNLASVIIPNSVISIGYNAFTLCGLTSITIPNSVKSVDDYAFYGCTGLSTIIIPNSVTTMGNSVFYGCSGLKTVTIGNSLAAIGDAVFVGCINLTTISVDTNNPNFCSDDGVLFDKNKTTLIRYPAGKQGSYTIPNSVNSIAKDAFGSCKGLTSVTIPNSVTSIGRAAFGKCYGLTSLTIPISVTSIEDWAFSYCWSLTDVTVFWTTTSSIVSSESMFYAVGVSNVRLHIPQGTLSIYQAALEWKNFLLVDDVIDIKEALSKSMKIYPNPVKDELLIESGELTVKKIKIIDVTGKIVENSTNVSALPQGIYFVKIETDKGIITQKIVKE